MQWIMLGILAGGLLFLLIYFGEYLLYTVARRWDDKNSGCSIGIMILIALIFAVLSSLGGSK